MAKVTKYSEEVKFKGLKVSDSLLQPKMPTVLSNSERRKARRKARRENRKDSRAERAEAFKNRDRYSTAARMNIDHLRYQFDQGARPNRYEVNFFCPALGLDLEGVRCITASLPGRQLETADWSEYGPTRKMPYQIGMDGQEVSFTFICDSSFADRFLIEAWQGAIFSAGKAFNEKTITETDEEGNVLSSETKKVGEGRGGLHGNSINPQFAYYNEYVGRVEIKQITRSDKDSLVYTIYEAYPISFAPMELSAENSDQLMRFETTFAFRTWTSEYKNPNPVSGINKGRRFFDLWASVTNLRKGGNSSNNTLQRFNDRLARLGGI